MSTQHVFVLAIGPVQGFIAAARRTRDLWYGSKLLSGLARAASECLQTQPGAQLIFPAGLRVDTKLHASHSNKIVCLVPTAFPAELAADVKVAVRASLRVDAQKCLAAVRRARGICDEARFWVQIEHALELQTAWCAVPDVEPDAIPATDLASPYMTAYLRATLALDARKRTRNFPPNASASAGALLSSLDGEHETVLCDEVDDRAGHRLRQRFGIDSTEELDALGLMKRVLGAEAAGPSVVRVALEPWISSWKPEDTALLKAELEQGRALGLSRGVVCDPHDLWTKLPFDCEVLLPSRRGRARSAAPPEDKADIERALDSLEELLVSLDANKARRFSLPDVDALYVALVVADGDQLGKVLTNNDQLSADFHRAVSAELALFAGEVPGLVAGQGGACNYAGGDDLIAMVPASSALACARALADRYATLMAAPAAPSGLSATLSVGIAYGHVLMPFGELRNCGHQALKLAKEGLDGKGLRNALALAVHPRSGASVSVSGRWNEPGPQPLKLGFDRWIELWTGAFSQSELSGSAPYDLSRLLRDSPERLRPQEAARLFARRSPSKELLAAIQGRLSAKHAGSESQRMAQLANEWYVARWLAARPGPPPAAAGRVSPAALAERAT